MHGQDIRGPALSDEFFNVFKDQAVAVIIKILNIDTAADQVEDLIVEKERAEDRVFGFFSSWRGTVLLNFSIIF